MVGAGPEEDYNRVDGEGVTIHRGVVEGCRPARAGELLLNP